MREVLTYRLADATKLTLRPALPDDAPAIISVVRSSSEERSYVLMEIYGKGIDAQRAWLEKLDRKHNLFLVAVVEGRVAGILALLDTLICSSPTPALAVGVHVAGEWRGRGIGSAMLRYALRWARENGYRRLEADIFTSNKRSLHLFGKAGFREVVCRRRTVQLGIRQINEVVFEKTLS